MKINRTQKHQKLTHEEAARSKNTWNLFSNKRRKNGNATEKVPGKITSIRFPAPFGVESVGSSVNFAVISLVHVRAGTRFVNRVVIIPHPRSREQIALLHIQSYIIANRFLYFRYRLGIRFGVGDIDSVTDGEGLRGGRGWEWGWRRRRRRRRRRRGKRLNVEVEIWVDGGRGAKSGSGGEEEEERKKEQCEEEESGYSVRPLLENHLPSLSNIPTPSHNIHARITFSLLLIAITLYQRVSSFHRTFLTSPVINFLNNS